MKSSMSAGLGALAILIGVIWIVQGLGYLKGSFMTGHLIWTVIGGVVVIGGLVAIARSRRGSDPPDRTTG
jgi:hypothetical protein